MMQGRTAGLGWWYSLRLQWVHECACTGAQEDRLEKMPPSPLEQGGYLAGYFLTIGSDLNNQNIRFPYLWVVCSLIAPSRDPGCCPESFFPAISSLLLHTFGVPCSQQLGHRVPCSRTLSMGSLFPGIITSHPAWDEVRIWFVPASLCHIGEVGSQYICLKTPQIPR